MNLHRIIAIGGSLGAVDAVKRLCGAFPPDLAASLAIVIHVGAEGNNFLAGIFQEISVIHVRTAVDGEPLQQGHAYIAPADHHLLVIGDVIRLGRGPRENLARPAIDPLFRSVAVNYGPRAIAVVLSGMLNDGVAGLSDLKRCGGITVVQNPGDAVAPDMPLGALRASDVDYRASLADLDDLLVKLTKETVGPAPPIPEDILLEVEIALGRSTNAEEVMRLGEPVPLSCPACGGVLSQIRRLPPLRFRCQVGHAYTAETLETEKEDTIDEAMRVALRIVEERAVLTGKMAEEARRSGRPAAAAIYDQRSRECRGYEEILRKAVLR